jgi:hypothetical protein
MTAFPSGAGAAGEARRLVVPYRSQLDGDPYQGGNCGPATMAMVVAEEVLRGGPFRREVLIAQFRDTDEIDYCDPRGGGHGGGHVA